MQDKWTKICQEFTDNRYQGQVMERLVLLGEGTGEGRNRCRRVQGTGGGELEG